jgi:hypothetical protein
VIRNKSNCHLKIFKNSGSGLPDHFSSLQLVHQSWVWNSEALLMTSHQRRNPTSWRNHSCWWNHSEKRITLIGKIMPAGEITPMATSLQLVKIYLQAKSHSTTTSKSHPPRLQIHTPRPKPTPWQIVRPWWNDTGWLEITPSLKSRHPTKPHR